MPCTVHLAPSTYTPPPDWLALGDSVERYNLTARAIASRLPADIHLFVLPTLRDSSQTSNAAAAQMPTLVAMAPGSGAVTIDILWRRGALADDRLDHMLTASALRCYALICALWPVRKESPAAATWLVMLSDSRRDLRSPLRKRAAAHTLFREDGGNLPEVLVHSLNEIAAKRPAHSLLTAEAIAAFTARIVPY